MFGTASAPRCDETCRALTALAGALLLAWLPACANEASAHSIGDEAGRLNGTSTFDADVTQSWGELIAHSTRISPTPDWDGSLKGMKTLWFDDGAKRAEGLFSHGLRQGPWTCWYEHGQKRWEGSYHDGLVDGVERSWHPSGALCFEGSSVAGQRHGVFRAWYSDGKPWWEGVYDLGVREGAFRYWRRDGTLDEKVSGTYSRGKRIGPKSEGELAAIAAQ